MRYSWRAGSRRERPAQARQQAAQAEARQRGREGHAEASARVSECARACGRAPTDQTDSPPPLRGVLCSTAAVHAPRRPRCSLFSCPLLAVCVQFSAPGAPPPRRSPSSARWMRLCPPASLCRAARAAARRAPRRTRAPPRAAAAAPLTRTALPWGAAPRSATWRQRRGGGAPAGMGGGTRQEARTRARWRAARECQQPGERRQTTKPQSNQRVRLSAASRGAPRHRHSCAPSHHLISQVQSVHRARAGDTTTGTA